MSYKYKLEKANYQSFVSRVAEILKEQDYEAEVDDYEVDSYDVEGVHEAIADNVTIENVVLKNIVLKNVILSDPDAAANLIIEELLAYLEAML